MSQSAPPSGRTDQPARYNPRDRAWQPVLQFECNASEPAHAWRAWVPYPQSAGDDRGPHPRYPKQGAAYPTAASAYAGAVATWRRAHHLDDQEAAPPVRAIQWLYTYNAADPVQAARYARWHAEVEPRIRERVPADMLIIRPQLGAAPPRALNPGVSPFAAHAATAPDVQHALEQWSDQHAIAEWAARERDTWQPTAESRRDAEAAKPYAGHLDAQGGAARYAQHGGRAYHITLWQHAEPYLAAWKAVQANDGTWHPALLADLPRRQHPDTPTMMEAMRRTARTLRLPSADAAAPPSVVASDAVTAAYAARTQGFAGSGTAAHDAATPPALEPALAQPGLHWTPVSRTVHTYLVWNETLDTDQTLRLDRVVAAFAAYHDPRHPDRPPDYTVRQAFPNTELARQDRPQDDDDGVAQAYRRYLADRAVAYIDQRGMVPPPPTDGPLEPLPVANGYTLQAISDDQWVAWRTTGPDTFEFLPDPQSPRHGPRLWTTWAVEHGLAYRAFEASAADASVPPPYGGRATTPADLALRTALRNVCPVMRVQPMAHAAAQVAADVARQLHEAGVPHPPLAPNGDVSGPNPDSPDYLPRLWPPGATEAADAQFLYVDTADGVPHTYPAEAMRRREPLRWATEHGVLYTAPPRPADPDAIRMYATLKARSLAYQALWHTPPPPLVPGADEPVPAADGYRLHPLGADQWVAWRATPDASETVVLYTEARAERPRLFPTAMVADGTAARRLAQAPGGYGGTAWDRAPAPDAVQAAARQACPAWAVQRVMPDGYVAVPPPNAPADAVSVLARTPTALVEALSAEGWRCRTEDPPGSPSARRADDLQWAANFWLTYRLAAGTPSSDGLAQPSLTAHSTDAPYRLQPLSAEQWVAWRPGAAPEAPDVLRGPHGAPLLFPARAVAESLEARGVTPETFDGVPRAPEAVTRVVERDTPVFAVQCISPDQRLAYLETPRDDPHIVPDPDHPDRPWVIGQDMAPERLARVATDYGARLAVLPATHPDPPRRWNAGTHGETQSLTQWAADHLPTWMTHPVNAHQAVVYATTPHGPEVLPSPTARSRPGDLAPRPWLIPVGNRDGVLARANAQGARCVDGDGPVPEAILQAVERTAPTLIVQPATATQAVVYTQDAHGIQLTPAPDHPDRPWVLPRATDPNAAVIAHASAEGCRFLQATEPLPEAIATLLRQAIRQQPTPSPEAPAVPTAPKAPKGPTLR